VSTSAGGSFRFGRPPVANAGIGIRETFFTRRSGNPQRCPAACRSANNFAKWQSERWD
jgi:hypothetical protein